MTQLDDPLNLLMYLNERGASLSRTGTTLTVNWPVHRTSLEVATVNAAVWSHGATILRWMDALQRNVQVSQQHRTKVENGTEVWGDGRVHGVHEGKSTTRLVRHGSVVNDNVLALFDGFQRFAGDESLEFCIAWFGDGTKVHGVPWIQGTWHGDVFHRNERLGKSYARQKPNTLRGDYEEET